MHDVAILQELGIAILVFRVMGIPSESRIGKCPLCEGVLTPHVIRPGPFDCPHCLKRIQPKRGRVYAWSRICVTLAFAIVVARTRGFPWFVSDIRRIVLRASDTLHVGIRRIHLVSAY